MSVLMLFHVALLQLFRIIAWPLLSCRSPHERKFGQPNYKMQPPLSSTNFLHHIRCQVREPQSNQKCLDTASSSHNWRSLVESSAGVTSQTLQWIQSLFRSCQSVYIRRHCFKHMMHLVQATRGQQKPCTDYDKSHIGWAWLGTLNVIAESASFASKLSLPYQRKCP